MNKKGPSAELKSVGIDHHYFLFTLPVSLSGEEPSPLLLTGEAGKFTRDGCKVGLYNPGERESALMHYRAFAKMEGSVIDVDGRLYAFKKLENSDEEVTVIHEGSPDIFHLNNYSVTRFASKVGWFDDELISLLSSLMNITNKMGSKLSEIYSSVAGEGDGEKALDEAALKRIYLKKKMDDFGREAWEHMTGVVVPEIVRMVRSGQIDVMDAAIRLSKGIPL